MKKPTFPVGVVIVLFLLHLFPFGKAINATVVPRSALSQKDLLEVKVYRLIVDPRSMQPVVLIVDQSGERAMPIWIGANEAMAIQMEIEGTKTPRPMTHDLLGRVIRQLNAAVRRVIITQERGGVYYAVLVLEKDGTLIEIDARPSDAMAMALKFNVPILISRSLFQAKAAPLDQRNVEEAYGLSIQEVTPEIAESFSFKEAKGVLIADVMEGSRAEKDGLQRGDILVEIGGEKVEAVPALRSVLADVKGSAKVRLFRNGNYVTLTINPAD